MELQTKATPVSLAHPAIVTAISLLTQSAQDLADCVTINDAPEVPSLQQVLALGQNLQRIGPPAPPRPGPPPGDITLTEAQRIRLDLFNNINKAQDATNHDERRGMGLTYRRFQDAKNITCTAA